MKREDLKQVYAYASLLWETFKVPTEKENIILQAQIWYDFLKEYDLETIFASMRELCKESDFCNIGKIAKGCQTIYNINKNEINEEEKIFNEINKAISFYNSKENFNNLSDVAKRVVVNPSNLSSWAMCENEDFNTVVASNIRKSIRNQLSIENKKQSIGIETLNKIKANVIEQENKNLLENSKKLLKNS